MKWFGMTKLRALGCTAVIALIVVASDSGLTETRRDNDQEAVNQMAEAPTHARSSTSQRPSMRGAATEISGEAGAAAGRPGEAGAAAGNHSPDGVPRSGPTVSSAISDEVGSGDRAATTTVPITTAGQWVQVASMRGGADERSALFRLGGGEVRLRYDHGGDGLFLVSVAEPDPGGEQDEEIYYADRSCSAPCRGTQPLEKKAGNYYLEVRSTNGPWSVVLEEYR